MSAKEQAGEYSLETSPLQSSLQLFEVRQRRLSLALRPCKVRLCHCVDESGSRSRAIGGVMPLHWLAIKIIVKSKMGQRREIHLHGEPVALFAMGRQRFPSTRCALAQDSFVRFLEVGNNSAAVSRMTNPPGNDIATQQKENSCVQDGTNGRIGVATATSGLQKTPSPTESAEAQRT